MKICLKIKGIEKEKLYWMRNLEYRSNRLFNCHSSRSEVDKVRCYFNNTTIFEVDLKDNYSFLKS